jgi:hypothetical protein
MKAPIEILEGLLTDEISVWDVVGWANCMLTELAPETNDALLHLTNLDPRETPDVTAIAVRELISLIPNANDNTPHELKIAREIKRLLNRVIPPFQFCKIVNSLDASLSDSGRYPKWLGELWNACDWCDESWTLENQKHLKDTAERLLTTLNER